METRSRITLLVDELIDLFNRRGMDLPTGLFDRHTQFVLNGAAFEEMLGRSPDDPLILMLARGPAGYRFTVKALQHAVPDAQISRGELAESTIDGTHAVRGQCRLSGHLRGTGQPTDSAIEVELTLDAHGVIDRAAVTIDEKALADLREARLR
jgi:hypothetical protein